MPKISYAFEKGGPKKLEIAYKGLYKNLTVTVDGRQVGEFTEQKELTSGKSFTLKDGSLLKVQLVSNFAGTELRVLRNGQALPDSASNPETRVKTAWGVLFFIAGLNLLLGAVTLFVESDYLEQMGFGWYNLIYGVFFLGMGFLVRRLSNVALILSILVFSADTVMSLFTADNFDTSPSLFWLISRIVLIIPLVQGVSAIMDLKKTALPVKTKLKK